MYTYTYNNYVILLLTIIVSYVYGHNVMCKLCSFFMYHITAEFTLFIILYPWFDIIVGAHKINHSGIYIYAFTVHTWLL